MFSVFLGSDFNIAVNFIMDYPNKPTGRRPIHSDSPQNRSSQASPLNKDNSPDRLSRPLDSGSKNRTSSCSPVNSERGTSPSGSNSFRGDKSNKKSSISPLTTRIRSKSPPFKKPSADEGDNSESVQRKVSYTSYAQSSSYTESTNIRTSLSKRPIITPKHYTIHNDARNEIKIFVFVILALVIAATAYLMTSSREINEKKSCSFYLLENEFPTEGDNLWEMLKFGTESILNNDPAVPGVYLFLHSNSSLPRDLVWKIAKRAAECFNPALKPIELNNKDFTSEETIKDYGVVIEKFKKEIKEGGALIVANLNEIPGEAARALHAICDTYTPIVRKVVIFLTLVTPTDQAKRDIQIAEDILFDLWGSSINRNDLAALITRVTEQVFRIHTT